MNMPHIEYMASHWRKQLAKERAERRRVLLAMAVACWIAFAAGMILGMAVMAAQP